MKFRTWMGVGALALGAVSAHGATPQGWSGKAGLGYLSTSGNSDSTNVNANLNVGYDWEKWHHTIDLLAIGAQSDGEGSAERYTADYKAKRDFNEFDYLFGLVSYQKDRFSGVEQQLSEAIGYGRRLLNNDTHVLNVEAGLGFRQIDFRDGTDDSGAIARLGGDYLWRFSDTAQFTQKLVIEAGSDNTSTESVSAVSAKLYEALSLALSYTIKNNSDVPVGSTSTDKFTAIKLEYAW